MNSTFLNIPTDKQQKIIGIAMKQFAEHGYENASTNSIIKELKISKGSLFKYFSTKLDLYEYLVNDAVTKLLSHLNNKDLVGSSWRERILSYASIEFDFLIKEPVIYKFFYRVIKELQNPQLTNISNNLLEQSNSYLQEIYQKIMLPKSDNNCLALHISFILKGYNEHFLGYLSESNITIDQKERYLIGLKKHLNLIGDIQ